MLKNYYKIGLRNISKQRASTIINVIGLTIGMTTFILIARYIQYEFSYDSNHEKLEQIYRVAQIQKGNTFRGTDRFAGTPEPLAEAMKENFPKVKEATLLQLSSGTFMIEEEVVQGRLLYADENLFDVFTFPIIEGIGKGALKDPNAIVISESMSKKYFGSESSIGKTIMFGEKPLLIKGVMKDIPDNQHFAFDYLTSVKNYSDYSNDIGQWSSNNYVTYFVLEDGYDYKELEPKLQKFVPQILTIFKEYKLDIVPEFFIQPLKDIHLFSNINFEIGTNGDIRYIWLSVSIAMIILLLALINYINLASVSSPKRTKETGIRKILGARKKQLIYQYITESSIITLFSFGIALVFSRMLLPFFNQIMDKKIPLEIESSQEIYLGMLSVALLLGVLSGLYPAIISTAIEPAIALKGRWLKNNKNSAILRNVLVVGQFAAAIILVIGTIIVYQQLNFIQTKKIGYSREQIVFLPYSDEDVFNKTDVIKNELLKHPAIQEASFAAYTPLNMYSQGFADEWEGNEKVEQFGVYRNYVDEEFIELYDMEIVEGRNFSASISTDTMNAYILNEAAVKAIGWESPIGKEFENGRVIGVVKDFHFLPFDLKIEPLFLKYRKRSNFFRYANIALKINMDEKESAIGHFQTVMKTIAPKLPFNYRFMDESYNQIYDAEKRFGEAFSIFTIIALFIACIGLFGLVSHNVTQRTKEIGIRKVIGASITNIVLLLSKDFIKLILIAVIVAFPLAYLFVESWLQDFAYRIEISWWIFLLAAVAAIGIAFLTMSIKSIKAASVNPAKSLKSE